MVHDGRYLSPKEQQEWADIQEAHYNPDEIHVDYVKDRLAEAGIENGEVVDEENNLTGKIEERNIIHKEGLWHREISVWIMNEKGEIISTEPKAGTMLKELLELVHVEHIPLT